MRSFITAAVLIAPALVAAAPKQAPVERAAVAEPFFFKKAQSNQSTKQSVKQIIDKAKSAAEKQLCTKTAAPVYVTLPPVTVTITPTPVTVEVTITPEPVTVTETETETVTAECEPTEEPTAPEQPEAETPVEEPEAETPVEEPEAETPTTEEPEAEVPAAAA